MHFETSQPAIAVLYQTSGVTGSQMPANIFLPPMSQWANNYQFYVPTDRIAYVGIAIDTYYVDDLHYDATTASGLFSFQV